MLDVRNSFHLCRLFSKTNLIGFFISRCSRRILSYATYGGWYLIWGLKWPLDVYYHQKLGIYIPFVTFTVKSFWKCVVKWTYLVAIPQFCFLAFHFGAVNDGNINPRPHEPDRKWIRNDQDFFTSSPHQLSIPPNRLLLPRQPTHASNQRSALFSPHPMPWMSPWHLLCSSNPIHGRHRHRHPSLLGENW